MDIFVYLINCKYAVNKLYINLFRQMHMSAAILCTSALEI